MAERPESDQEWAAKQRKLFPYEKKDRRVKRIHADRKARSVVLWEDIKQRIEEANNIGSQTFFWAGKMPMEIVMMAAAYDIELVQDRTNYYAFAFSTPSASSERSKSPERSESPDRITLA
jgi:predicted ATP-grasp superfamily ATP-dependent carboligase